MHPAWRGRSLTLCHRGEYEMAPTLEQGRSCSTRLVTLPEVPGGDAPLEFRLAKARLPLGGGAGLSSLRKRGPRAPPEASGARRVEPARDSAPEPSRRLRCPL